MITIYKYEIEPGVKDISMREDAEILCVREQFNAIQLWARVNASSSVMHRRTFTAIPTGGEFPDIQPNMMWSYVGTAMLGGGSLVFHVFERVVNPDYSLANQK